MFRAITSIALLVVLVGGNATTAAAFCAPTVDHKSDRSAATHCKKTPTKTAAPMSCCQRTPFGHSEEIAKGSADCCQMRAPLPGQSRSTQPANSSEEFRLQTHSQLLDSSEPLLSSAMAFAGVSSTISFCPNRSDTYLLVSTFRI